jgi:hypothetical protein
MPKPMRTRPVTRSRRRWILEFVNQLVPRPIIHTKMASHTPCRRRDPGRPARALRLPRRGRRVRPVSTDSAFDPAKSPARQRDVALVVRRRASGLLVARCARRDRLRRRGSSADGDRIGHRILWM